MPVSKEKLSEQYKAFQAKVDATKSEAYEYSREGALELAAEGKTLMQNIEEFKAASSVAGTADESAKFFNELAGRTDENQKRADETGIVDPKGMTFGEAASKSAAFEEITNKGAIKEIKGHIGRQLLYAPEQGDGVKTLFDTRLQGGANLGSTERLPMDAFVPSQRQRLAQFCNYASVGAGYEFEVVVEALRTNNAGMVPEATTAERLVVDGGAATATTGGLKPESAYELTSVKVPFETIAHWIPVTRRAAASEVDVMSLIDDFMTDGLVSKENQQILNGTGTSPEYQGILNETIPTVASAGLSDIDVVAVALGQIWGANKTADTMVVHPDDWWTDGFLLSKDLNGSYRLANPGASADAVRMLWGLNVLVDAAMTPGSVLVGDMRYVSYRDKGNPAIYITDSNRDFFERNILTILAEMEGAVKLRDASRFRLITGVDAN